MPDEEPTDRQGSLSTLPAGRRDRRLAAAALLVSLAIFLIALPFAKVPLTPVWAFIPVYQVHVGLHGRRGRPPRGAA